MHKKREKILLFHQSFFSTAVDPSKYVRCRTRQKLGKEDCQKKTKILSFHQSLSYFAEWSLTWNSRLAWIPLHFSAAPEPAPIFRPNSSSKRFREKYLNGVQSNATSEDLSRFSLKFTILSLCIRGVFLLQNMSHCRMKLLC